VLQLYPNGAHHAGKGRNIVTEQAIHGFYRIKNRIVDIPEYEKRLYISLE
jgi:leucyl-tRNA synthetase